MNSVTIESAESVRVCTIHELSDDIKDAIRSELNNICYGKERVSADDSDYYSYENTLREFLDRYDTKSQKIQIGMLGELLTHILIKESFPELTVVSVFFNKEERSIKKGFDLTYLNKSTASVWYGEVKSGERQQHTVQQKNKILISKAKSDLTASLNGERRSIWESALLDADLTLSTEPARTVKDLFKRDSAINPAEREKKAVLTSVLFSDTSDVYSLEAQRELFNEINDGQYFSELVLLSIQKSTFAKIEDFLKAEAGIAE